MDHFDLVLAALVVIWGGVFLLGGMIVYLLGSWAYERRQERELMERWSREPHSGPEHLCPDCEE